MSISNVIASLQQAYGAIVPPGLSAVTPSNGATGVVTASVSPAPLGSFLGILQVLTTGALGAATAQLSLDGGASFAPAFTIPANGTYPVPLDASPVLSGVRLGFSGTFTAGNSYTFTANGTCSFSVGEEFIPFQGSIFPRIVFVPTRSRFTGSKDFSLTKNQVNSPRALATDLATLEAHCWGCDYSRADLLRDQLINAIWAVAGSAGAELGEAEWVRNKYEVNKAGRVVVMTFTILKPVTEFAQTWTTVAGPFTEINSQQVDPYTGG